MPPHRVAFEWYLAPNKLPIFVPIAEKAKVTAPIKVTAGRIETLINAKLTPTANASMLVAIAKTSIDFHPISGSIDSSSWKESQIILPPIIDNKIKAIQWSNCSSQPLASWAKQYPRNGIKPWKIPNHAPNHVICFQVTFFNDKPFAIDTAKASIESERAIKNNSIQLKIDLLFFREPIKFHVVPRQE